MRGPVVAPATYRRVSGAALLALVFIVITGGAVRLTGSGLGCPDWPTCADDRLVPVAAAGYHAMVEFVNRAITGLVSIAVILAVLGSLARRPRRRDLVWLSLGLVAGVVGQILLGGLAVLSGLRPEIVMAHFLLSMVLLANATVLHERAAQPDGAGADPAPRGTRRRPAGLARALAVAATVAIFLGTVVTGSGPHGGDPDAPRLPFAVPAAARLHGLAVVAFLGLAIAACASVRRSTAVHRRRAATVLAVGLAQAGVGYLQYFTGVPVLLVGVHIAGAAALWVAVVRFVVASSERPRAGRGVGSPGVASRA